MNIALEEHWKDFITSLVASGRYRSASEVVCEALRLVRERAEKLEALRRTIDASIAEGGRFSDEEIGAMLDAQAEAP